MQTKLPTRLAFFPLKALNFALSTRRKQTVSQTWSVSARLTSGGHWRSGGLVWRSAVGPDRPGPHGGGGR